MWKLERKKEKKGGEGVGFHESQRKIIRGKRPASGRWGSTGEGALGSNTGQIILLYCMHVQIRNNKSDHYVQL